MSNPVRTCIGCAKSDDHPRHVSMTADGYETAWHMDCCAIARNCEVCAAQLEGVGGIDKNPKGGMLRQYLVTTGPNADQPGWSAPVDEPGDAPAKTRKG